MTKRSRILLAACGLIACFNGMTAANNVTLNWHKHNNTTTTNATIGTWCTTGTTRLQEDDDAGGALDVAATTTLVNGGVQAGWTYTDGDDSIDDDAELTAAFAGMTRNAACVTTIWNAWGYQSGTKIIVAGDSTTPTTVHEVGHLAGLDHVDPGVHKRIMMTAETAGGEGMGGAEARSRIICSEKDAYEAL